MSSSGTAYIAKRTMGVSQTITLCPAKGVCSHKTNVRSGHSSTKQREAYAISAEKHLERSSK